MISPASPTLPELRLELAPPDVEAPLAIAVLLADRNRATILAILRDGPHCVCELAAALDERSNNVSNHLARLREAGLVRASASPPTPAACTTSATRPPARRHSRS